MDKHTLSEYAWILITVMVLAVLLVAAGPLGRNAKDTIDEAVEKNVANAFEGPEAAHVVRYTGCITDKDKEFVSDYTVVLVDEEGNRTETKTDKNGRYSFIMNADTAVYKKIYIEFGSEKYECESELSQNGGRGLNIKVPVSIMKIKHNLSGSVFYKDADGNKVFLKDVTVTVIDKNTRVTIDFVKTGDDGLFSFKLLPDEYDVTFSSHKTKLEDGMEVIDYKPVVEKVTAFVSADADIEALYEEAE